MKFTAVFAFIFLVFLYFSPASNIVSCIPVDELGFKNFIDNNDNEIIIDIRWLEVYTIGHIRFAHLVDSGGTFETRAAATDNVLASQNAQLNTPIGLYCNCPNGERAAEIESYLLGKGYTNIVHLQYSFSQWQDYTYLVSGSSPDGSLLTSLPTNLGGATAPFDPFLFAIIGGVALLVVGVVYFLKTNPTTQQNLQSEIIRSDRKKARELDNIRQLLSERTKYDAEQNAKLTKK